MGQELKKRSVNPSKPYTPPPFERTAELNVAPRQGSLRERRCAWCHEDIGRALSRTCEDCGITLHDFCGREVRRCPTAGCDRDWRQEPLIVRKGREEDAERRLTLWNMAFSLAMLVLVSFIQSLVKGLWLEDVLGAVVLIAVVWFLIAARLRKGDEP